MIIYKEYMSVSLLNAAKFRCDDFECVAENVNQRLALTHLGPGRPVPIQPLMASPEPPTPTSRWRPSGAPVTS